MSRKPSGSMKPVPPLVAPSILSADYTNLQNSIRQSVDGGAEWIHCDVMDGHFVPNITFGPMIVKAARRSCKAFLDVHLMIFRPEDHISAFIEAGADLISVHCEATTHIHRTLGQIREAGAEAGVAINPGTPLSMLEPVLDDVKLVVLMSVNPGFGGQAFIESTYERIAALKKMRLDRNAGFLIQIDGGVNMGNIEKISRSGADILVAGSSVFHSSDISQTMRDLTRQARAGKTALV